MKEFRRVVDSADVILQVLDARDPLGCRCYEAERAIMAAGGGSKRIVLVLNKVDLVPKEVTQKWLTYLRNDFPTVAFRAALQGQVRQYTKLLQSSRKKHCSILQNPTTCSSYVLSFTLYQILHCLCRKPLANGSMHNLPLPRQ